MKEPVPATDLDRQQQPGAVLKSPTVSGGAGRGYHQSDFLRLAAIRSLIIGLCHCLPRRIVKQSSLTVSSGKTYDYARLRTSVFRQRRLSP